MGRYRQPYSLTLRGEYWYYRTYNSDGVRTHMKSTGCKSKNAAREYCNELWRRGELWSTDQTFGQYALHFYDEDGLYWKDRLEKPSYNTFVDYERHMKNHIMPYFQHRKLVDINYTTLKQYRSKMIDDGYSPSMVISSMSVLKHVIEYAYRDRLIPTNPFDVLEPLPMKKQERDAFTFEEVKKLYQLIPDEFKKSILCMALTGVRISECIGLPHNEIIQAEGFEYIYLKQQFNRGDLRILKGKNARPIPIIPEIKDFIGFDPLRLSAFYREYNKIKKTFNDADKRKLCFHSLRHFFITNAKSSGVSEIKVEVIAGHSLKGIAKVYTNFKAEDLTDILAWQKTTLEALTK